MHPPYKTLYLVRLTLAALASPFPSLSEMIDQQLQELEYGPP